MFGLLVMSFGIVLYLKSGLGANPLTAFINGVAKTLGFSVGRASQIIMLFTMIIVYFIDKNRIGIGTVINAVFTGVFIDILMNININNHLFIQNITVLMIGIITFSIGLAIYIEAELGEGAIDAFMIIIQDKFSINIDKSRIILDIILVVIAYFLGGDIGLGTVLAVIFTGPIMNKTINKIDEITGGN